MAAHILAVLFLFVIAPASQVWALEPGADFAVAAFTQPKSNWELLGGYLPQDAGQAPAETLKELDAMLEETLREQGVHGFTSAGETGRCEELILSRMTGSQVSALAYWREVGQCVNTDRLLVPMLIDWRERVGGELAVKEPARVVLDLYLIDVAAGEIIDRYHHEETQRSLSENLLDLPKFLKRGAQWVTAKELAHEALVKGVEELGL